MHGVFNYLIKNENLNLWLMPIVNYRNVLVSQMLLNNNLIFKCLSTVKRILAALET